MASSVSTHSEAKPQKPKASSSNSSSRQRRPQNTNSSLDNDSKKLKSPSSLSLLQEMFPLWKDDDLLSVLAESGNDPNIAAEKIYDGTFICFHFLKSLLRLSVFLYKPWVCLLMEGFQFLIFNLFSKQIIN